MTNSVIKNSITLNGFEMYYEIQGKGEPLLLLHGFSGSGAGLLEGFKQLSENHTLIVPDLRGHGRSTNPSKSFTFQQAALDVFALLAHLNIQQCSGLGFSGGGCTLLQMAYQQPEIVKSMVIVSAAPYFPPYTRDVMKQYAAQTKSEAEWARMRGIHVHGDEQINMIWQQAADFSESYDDMNFTPEKLSKITTKTLIVQGDRDPIYPIDLTIEMYKAMPNAFLWIVPNGGHGPVSINSTGEFIRCMEAYL